MDFWTKSLSESVNGTNAGRKSLPEDKGQDVPADASSSKDKAPEPSLEDARYLEKRDATLAFCRAKSDRTRKLAASPQSPYTANNTAKMIIQNKKLYPGYNPFAPIDKKKLKELADWLKTCPHYRTPLDKKPRTSRTWWYQILRTSLEWLEDCHIDAWINVLRKRCDANPQYFRSERMCFIDHLFAQQWSINYKDFKDSESDQNGLGRRLPGGAWNYYAGTIPSFCQSNTVWGMDIDDVYAPVNYNDTDWIAMWISIPKRHKICSSISPEELDVRPTNIPPVRAGDCGVYSLKYIECHALGIEFSKKDFAKPNGKTMRDKMAVDIFQELPDAHEFENKDNDANMGAYEGEMTSLAHRVFSNHPEPQTKVTHQE
ncbi:BnaC08g04360D [Brassica napus]|uniref:BnaC08g04360D protein n=1 Tax=Brassica napus TaxID=3708 RepID=A0A078FYD4_BRANA|nr:BnaC08g04360D [Brassica napus]